MTDPSDTCGAPDPEPGHPHRRTVLRAAGLVALAGTGAGGVAACAPAAEPAPASAPPTAASAPASSAPAPTASPTPAEPTSASPTPEASPSTKEPAPEPPDGPSVAVADVPVGGGVILDKDDYVVTQPKKGTFKAFSKICTHKGCPVTRVRDGLINCNCHQSNFSISDGSVVDPPASKALAEAKVEVVGKRVYVVD